MKCIILAAGYATRLYPLTENFPKPLLKVGEKTILDWLVEDLCEDPATAPEEFVVISNHKFAPHFEAWAKEKNEGGLETRKQYRNSFLAPKNSSKLAKVTVVDDGTSSNETRLGAVKDIQYAMDQLGLEDDLLIIAGDNVLDFSLGKFVAYAKEKGTSCTMRYYEESERVLKKSGISEIAGDAIDSARQIAAADPDRLLSLEEKPENPKSHWCTPPFYYYTKEDAARIQEAIEDGCGTDAPGSLVAWMCRHTVIHSMEMPGRRYDIGDIKSYEEVQRTYRGIIK